MKTWPQLEAWAARRKLAVHHQGGTIALYRATGDRQGADRRRRRPDGTCRNRSRAERGTAVSDLTPERVAKLRAFARGEQPELPPIQRRWFVAHGYLVPSAGPRPARLTSVRRRIAPRPHELTAKGREAVTP